MSTRFYPRFVKGNPQLRIFLPDWPLIMLKPKDGLNKMPNNIVTFKTDVRMTDWDIKNYLEKIYKVPVAAVKSRIISGPISLSVRPTTPFDVVKAEDHRLAQVTLPIGQTFEWPDLFPQEDIKKELSEYEKLVEEANKGRKEWWSGVS